MGNLPFDLEIKDISALADIVKKNKLGELRLEDEDIGARIIIKGSKTPPPPPPAPQIQLPPIIQGSAASVPAAAVSPAPAVTAQSGIPTGNTVKSPVVGTFYSSPSPEKPPFVKVGQHVNKGDIIMIIESMKIMNEVPSPYEGEVKEILIESGQAVEYDQPVMIIG
ncbi:MAG: acetyl-CoA carboxylase biotin carboxyl carrier protein [Ruminococcus sp.]|nr:acetyl-CoA carboxylase biotin carboxyl carrier protein [Ruminococcus sp.]